MNAILAQAIGRSGHHSSTGPAKHVIGKRNMLDLLRNYFAIIQESRYEPN